MSGVQLGLDIDPLVASALAGIVWPLIQAVADKVEWTPARRRLVALAAAIVLSAIIWWAGAYQATWRMLTAQAAVIAGCMQAAFTLLKSLGVLDWAGSVTPGGETRADYQARHRASDAPSGQTSGETVGEGACGPSWLPLRPSGGES